VSTPGRVVYELFSESGKMTREPHFPEKHVNGVGVLLLRTFSWGQPGGAWRLAALFFFLLALAGGAAAITEPAFARWTGTALLAAIGAAAVLMLIAAWPRKSPAIEEAERAASAAAVSNIAWAVTGRDGAVMDCNTAYRFLAGAGAGEPPSPPELAFAGQGAAAALYRLSRAAADARAREENFETETGQKLSAAIRPLKSGETAWWFTPRLPEAAPATGATAAEGYAPSALIRFSDFFRHAPVGVAIAGADGAVAESNNAFADFFGISPRGNGLQFADLADASERGAALDLIARAAAGEASHDPVEVRAGHMAGRSAQLFASPFAASPGGGARAILYLVDTSAQKALETQFAQSQKMQAVGQLAGGVAHDFNNLLTVIIGNCDLLLMRHPAGDPSFAELNEVQQNAVRAAGLVRQLLAFSRKQTLQPKVLALPDTLSELAMLLRRLLGERITLTLEHASDLWPVRADESQISNAIINLAVNARDAMPETGGAVAIRTSNVTVDTSQAVGSGVMPAGDYVAIDITDTGKGIPKDLLNKIFEPFFTTKEVGQGTGLGLSTVYGIVKQTGGFIAVESEVGKGATFRIYLPRYRAAQGEIAVTPVETEAQRHRDVTGQDTVLLVEDEDAVRSFAARALRMRGYQVMEANGGEAGLEIVRKHPGAIDLLVTDVVMPGMDGPTLVRAARRLRPGMRILFMSGYAEDAFRRNAERAEELQFLPKPFGIKQLAAKVKEVLSGAPPAAGKPRIPDADTSANT
jgi:two-component system, cell cycle sensor histidine kinase and response regulator CckA